jgi:hypothetical protein
VGYDKSMMSTTELLPALVKAGHKATISDGRLVVSYRGAEFFVAIDAHNALIRTALFHTDLKQYVTNEMLERIVGHVNVAVRGAKSIITDNAVFILSEIFATDANDWALCFHHMAAAMLQHNQELDTFSAQVRG